MKIRNTRRKKDRKCRKRSQKGGMFERFREKRELSRFLKDNKTGELFKNYADIIRLEIYIPIPKSIRLMRSLLECTLYYDLITEESLHNLAPLSRLSTLNVASTESVLEGLFLRNITSLKSVPESLFSLRQLTSLKFSNVSGGTPLSRQIGRLTNLDRLAVYSSFGGKIPEEIQNLSNLRRLCLHGTQMVGSINFVNLKRLRDLDLEYCNITCNLETLPQTMEEISICNTLNDGPFPQHFRHLYLLRLQNNQYSGEFPSLQFFNY